MPRLQPRFENENALLLVGADKSWDEIKMAVIRKQRAPKAALGKKVSKAMKRVFRKAAIAGGAARKASGLCDPEDAALVNAVVKAASVHLAK